ncbi:MAG: type IX secretion system membrane protein PorP/SprF [Bacteroidales bacterium]|nr:type IX secretion system membrane protein PorP/SprF [Bacteroidales bacterium]
MRRFLFILFILSFVSVLNAQEKALLYSHYSFNGLAVNPAYAGSRDMLSVSLSHRNQWMGFEGAPAYNIVGVHTPYKNTRMGLGLLVMNESIGLRKYTGIYVNYAHRIQMGRGKLALGLKGGVGTGNYDQVDLGNDPHFNDNSYSYLLPNFGVGAYYYTNRFYAGLSVPLLLGYKSNNSGEIITRHSFEQYAYYVTAGYKIDLTSDWQAQPAGLMVYEKAGGLIADLGVSVMYKDALRAGVSYRTKQAIVMLVDYKITYQLRAGIAYDYGINELNSYNRNSIEVALEYNFGYRVKAVNPTIF